MFSYYNNLNKYFGFEINILHWIQDISEGIIFFEFVLNWNRFENENTPTFEIMLNILNWNVLDFIIYKLNH